MRDYSSKYLASLANRLRPSLNLDLSLFSDSQRVIIKLPKKLPAKLARRRHLADYIFSKL